MVVLVVAGCSSNRKARIGASIHQILTAQPGAAAERVRTEVDRLYKARAYAPVWVQDGDLSKVDNDTVVGIYKGAAQLLILMLPLMFADGDDVKPELFPPPFEAMFERKPPNDPQQLPAYAAQLKRDIPVFRAHVEKVAEKNSSVAKNIQRYKAHLLTPVEPPNRVVKPMTGYGKGRVLRPDEKYYQIDDCAVIREDGQMRLIGYIFLKMRG